MATNIDSALSQIDPTLLTDEPAIEIEIENPEVVSKSYPHYWDDLRRAGFSVEEVNE